MTTFSWFIVSDGDCQFTSLVQAETAEDAAEIWDDLYNPRGFEVPGHPWRDGLPRLIENKDDPRLAHYEQIPNDAA